MENTLALRDGVQDCIGDTGFNSSGVAIGVPMCGRPLSNKWGIYFANQDAGTNMAKAIIPVEGMEVGLARQLIAEQATGKNHILEGTNCVFCNRLPEGEICKSRHTYEYVFFVDDDVILPPQSLRELIDKLSKIRAYEEATEGGPKTVAIGGIYCTKEELSTPVAYKKLGSGPSWNWIRGQIFDVEGIGTGCLLIHTSIFAKLEKPWFKTVDEDHPDTDGSMVHTCITDDLYFCRKVKVAGYKIVAHGGIICGHYDYRSNKIYNLPKDCPPNKMAADIAKDPSLLEKYLANIAAQEAESGSLHCVLPKEDTSASSV